MITVGFIGLGSMGNMLVDGFINAGKLKPEEIVVSTRTKSKLQELKDRYSQINTAFSNQETAQLARCLFVCVKPADMKLIYDEIGSVLTPDSHVISLAETVSIKNIENLINCKITKFSPSIASEVKKGVSVICHNSKTSKADREYISNLLSAFGIVREVNEQDMSFAAQLTSCAPGYFSEILKEVIKAASKYSSGLPEDTVKDLTLKTLEGTLKLIAENDLTFDEVISRVATKGGITEEGIWVLKAGLPETFDNMFDKAIKKRNFISETVNQSFEV